MQEGDVNLFHTNDNGNITSTNGIIEMTGGFGPAAYLSLFGGNKDDDGRDGNNKTWWGNLDETEPEKKYVSETQYLLRSIPATSSNLLKIQEAAERDLNWFLKTKIASSITISVSIPKLNWVKIVGFIEAKGEEHMFEFVENWKAIK